YITLFRSIMPVTKHQRKREDLTFDEDEYIRPNTTKDILNKLQPAFREDGSVTSGNASGLNDGSCAMLVAGDDAINNFNLTPKARIVASAVVGLEQRIMVLMSVTGMQ